jgi:initiation factor 1A
MPNTFGGKNYKKSKSGNVRRRSKNPDMPVDTTSGFDYFGIVMKRLGNNRLQVKIDSGIEVQAIIPGRFMKKVWFNSGDVIHVRRESDKSGKNYYDVIQKVVNDGEKTKGIQLLSKHMNSDEQDIFNQNRQKDEDEDDVLDLPESDDEMQKDSDDEDVRRDDLLEEDNEEDDFDDFDDFSAKPKRNQPNQLKQQSISAADLIKKTVNVDKLNRKRNEKQRDTSRRTTTDYFEKPQSIVEESESSESSESSAEDTEQKSVDKSDTSDKSDKSEINIDDI